MSEPSNIVVIHTTPPPPAPPIHVHRFAWAMRTDGRTVAVCYECGARKS